MDVVSILAVVAVVVDDAVVLIYEVAAVKFDDAVAEVL